MKMTVIKCQCHHPIHEGKACVNDVSRVSYNDNDWEPQDSRCTPCRIGRFCR